MRWFSSFLTFSLLAVGTIAAKKSPEERFQDFHAKALSSSPVKLTDSNFKKLTNGPRDYTAMVLLTAMDARFGCQLCREFQPEWDILAQSWTKGDKAGDSRLILGTLDFADGRETFMSVSTANQCVWSLGLRFTDTIVLVARPSDSASLAAVSAHHWPSCRGVTGSSPLRLYQRVRTSSTTTLTKSLTFPDRKSPSRFIRGSFVTWMDALTLPFAAPSTG